jgi:hypothetical protein
VKSAGDGYRAVADTFHCHGLFLTQTRETGTDQQEVIYGHFDTRHHSFYRYSDSGHCGALSHDEQEEVSAMNAQSIAYMIFGFTLVILFGIIIVFYYSRKRHKKVEDPKYKMLEDDE